MSLSRSFGDEAFYCDNEKGGRSHSAEGLPNPASSTMTIPLPPKLWITDIEDDSSDNASGSVRDEGIVLERPRVRSRFRHHKTRVTSTSVPIGIFWDIENCQVPRGCSPLDVVSAIRAKFLPGRREADFVVVCDVRKEAAYVLQELNDAQVSLIHVCGTQKNAADEKLRQCMRRFAELHTAPAALLLISGDINFASDLSDFRHRKNMEVLLMHKQNTSSALIACASSHYCYNQLTANLPRNSKNSSFSRSNDDDEDPQCELEVSNIPVEQSVENVSRRLRRLADNCGGKVIKVYSGKALLKFPTPDHALRALKRMDGEDVYGRKIMTRYARSTVQPAPVYSSDEGYSTAPHQPPRPNFQQNNHQVDEVPSIEMVEKKVSSEWALALQQLPAPTPPPLDFCPPPAPKPRKIRGTHVISIPKNILPSHSKTRQNAVQNTGPVETGSVNLDRSGCSSSNSGCGDEGRTRSGGGGGAVSPWNSSSVSEQSEPDAEAAELTVGNLPPYEPHVLQEMLTQLFNQYVPVVRVSVWVGSDGPLATVVLRSEWDARLAIARVHKRRLGHQWTGRRLELSLGRPSPAPNLEVLKARLRAILLDQKNHMLPLLRLRDAYASRHCCALTTSDIGKVRDTVIIHENYGRMVQLIDLTPVTSAEMEEAPWKCHIHASLSTGQDDGSRMLQPVFMEVAVLAKNAQILLENHGGILPLLSFVDCYEATFQPLISDPQHGVALELLLRNASGLEVKDSPSRHLTWRTEGNDSPPSNSSQSDSSRSSGDREKPRTAPALEPMLALFERELIDLLRTAPRCTIPFCKLIPAFHHHFGRQCRVADYGFTRLPDLLAALSNTIVVLGSGSSRVITISAAAQSRRWTSDLVKLLKAQPGKSVSPKDIPELYQATFGKMFNPVDYGVCTVGELMHQVGPQSVTVSIDGTISLPRHEPTPAERARTVQFAIRTVELLCCTPNLRMEFSRFVPAYHSHYGRQLRVAHYGCVKLVDLFEMIPDVVSVCGEHNGERAVKLTARAARCVVGKRLNSLAPIPLVALPVHYARQYGAAPQPDMLDMKSLEELVYAAGGCIENGVVIPPGSAWRWSVAALSACAALCADRSVARGSTLDYFTATYRRITGTQPDIPHLVAAGVIRIEDSRVMLSTSWRTVFRIAQILAEKTSATAIDVFLEYTKRYEPVFHGTDSGAEGFCEYLRQYGDVFNEVNGLYTLAAGVVVPKTREMPSAVHEDYSIHDTPPGQKGSRVFESPKHNIWCSPPASALPTPSALLTLEKRRTRLAAQFDVS